MKPKFKLNCDGTRQLIQAGVSGLSEEQTKHWMVARSGSIQNYCKRHGLKYEAVLAALYPGVHTRVNAGAATRILLGLPLPGIEKFGRHPMCAYTKDLFDLLTDGHAADDYPDATQVAHSRKYFGSGLAKGSQKSVVGGASA
jgi:hypothetical protein